MARFLLLVWLLPALGALAVNSTGDARRATPWTSWVRDRSSNRVAVVERAGGRGPTLEMVVNAVADTPTTWHVQALRSGAPFDRLAPATAYALRFTARASRPRTLKFDLHGNTPNAWLNLRQSVSLGVESRRFDLTFRTPAAIPSRQAELGVYAGDELGTVWVDDVDLVPVQKTAVADNPVRIASFDSGEAWTSGTPDTRNARQGDAGLRLAVGANDAAFAAREVALDLGTRPSQISLWIHAETPVTIGRMGVLLRSGADGGKDLAFWTFSGLEAGWNHVVIPRTRFVVHPWQGTLDWSNVRTIGLKLESNGNGPAAVTVDDLSVEPLTPSDVLPPVIDQINVVNVTSTTATVEWRLDEPGAASLEYGTTASYGRQQPGKGTDGTSFSTTLGGLSPGRGYHARIRAVDREGHESVSGDFAFVTEPATPPVPTGGAAFPLGLYVVGGVSEVRRGDFRALGVVSGTPFTHVSTFFFSDCDQPDAMVQGYLDRAQAAGKKVRLTFCHRKLEPPTLDLEYVRERVRRYHGHPTLDSWYLLDEPDGSSFDQDSFGRTLKRAYQVVKAEDPVHPVFLNVARAERIGPYSGSMDAIATDTYPVPFRPVADIVPNLDAARRSGLPFEFTFQSFSTESQRWPGDNPNQGQPGRYPSYDEMRAMAYLAINRGARGLWTYAYGYIQDSPGSEWHWTDLTMLAQELRRLGPMLASRERPSVTARGASPLGLDVATRSYAGRSYVIVVNTRPTPIRGTVELSGGRVASIRERTGDRAIATNGSALSDAWQPFAVQVYEVRMAR